MPRRLEVPDESVSHPAFTVNSDGSTSMKARRFRGNVPALLRVVVTFTGKIVEDEVGPKGRDFDDN